MTKGDPSNITTVYVRMPFGTILGAFSRSLFTFTNRFHAMCSSSIHRVEQSLDALECAVDRSVHGVIPDDPHRWERGELHSGPSMLR